MGVNDKAAMKILAGILIALFILTGFRTDIASVDSVIFNSDGYGYGYGYSIIYGDINGDGVLDLKDAIYLAKHIVGLGGYEEIYSDPDTNCDGVVDLKDAIYLVKHVVRLEGYEQLYQCT